MPPGRRRWANKAMANSQLKLGDLVLAKVKGFPPWPAKISKPEDWERQPDSKKYFVKFFGTNEIAFIAPADVQAFTSELKTKLLSRSHSKTNYFAEALEEICAAFDEVSRHNSSCLQDDTDGSDFGSGVAMVDRVEENEVEGDLNVEMIAVESNEAMSDEFGDRVSDCFPLEGKVNGYDVKPKIEYHPNYGSSQVLSSEKGKKMPDVAEDKSVTSGLKSPQLKEELSGINDDDIRIKTPGNTQKSLNKSGQKSTVPASSTKRKYGDAIELNESNSSSVVASKVESPVGGADKPESRVQLKDGSKGKDVSDAIVGQYFDDLKSDSTTDGGEKTIDPLKGKVFVKVNNEPVREVKEGYYVRKRRLQPGGGKSGLQSNDNTHQAKKMESEVLGNGQGSQQKSKKMASGISDVADDKEVKTPELKKYSSRAKSEIALSVTSTTCTVTANESDDKELLTQSSIGQLQQTSVATVDGKTDSKSRPEKKEGFNNSNVRVPANQLHKRRRAVCIFDDDEEPKTPVHGGSAKKVKAPSNVLNDNKKTRAHNVSSTHAKQNVKRASSSQDTHSKESSRLLFKPQTPQLKKKETEPEKSMAGFDSHNLEKLESEQLSLKEIKITMNTPKKSPEFIIDPKQVVEEGNASKFPVSISRPAGNQKKDNALSVKGSGERSLKSPQVQATTSLNRPASSAERSQSTPKKSPEFIIDPKQVVEEGNASKFPVNISRPAGNQKKDNALSVKGSGERSLKSPQVQATTLLNRPASSAERSQSTPKSSNRVIDSAALNGMSLEHNHFSGRMEGLPENKHRSVIVSKTSDSGTSMKHLIAAAQAKRRQTHSKNTSLEISDSAVFSITDMPEQSPGSSLVQPLLPSTSNMSSANLPGSYHLPDLPSSPINAHPSTSSTQSDIGELEEGRVNSVNKATGDTLSGGTEASVARDAFEGMIETLSRTKESIGRATRLAIDCAKYGIANEVVELLIRKLETEAIVHRKVDLFFLVDSITQCSHSQRGIAGASYIPIVQAALPRLLGAAAPTGANARENRRQCHKVLRLWLERKILPETVLRRYIEEFGVSNDDTSVSFSLRRPARAERSVDDPIREMDGMLVDEYGSNATFQLPGFLPSRVFEDEDEDFENSSLKEMGNASPVSASHGTDDLEACAVTPSDRRHFILEDVDGELEMEDVSGQLKDSKPMVKNTSLEIGSPQQGLEKSMERDSDAYQELSPLPEASPPLPIDSPPSPPPLPPSPPPPLPPPPLSSSLPPPPPPPPTLLSQPPLPLPPLGPPPLLISPQLAPMPPSFPLRPILPPQSSQQLSYQVPVPHEYCSTSSANQLVQMGNLPHGGQVDVSVKSDRFQQQSPCFVPAGPCTSREASGFCSSRQLEYGQTDMHLNTQLSHPNQPFQQVNAPFVHGLPHPVPPLNPSSHFSFPKTASQHQSPHPYGPYSLPPLTDGRRQFSGDGQWQMPPGEFKPENRGLWMNGGRTSSHTGPPFGQEGYFQPLYERPPTNSISYQQPIPNNIPPGAPISGHGIPPILPSRPDISTLNSWRQA